MSETTLEFFRDASFGIFLLTCGLGFLIWWVVKTIGDVLMTRAFEASRREIAAYVAEGSISPAEAATLLAINSEPDESSAETAKKDPAKKLAGMVGWGTIKKRDAALLIEARSNVPESVWGEMVTLVSKGMPAAEAIRLASLRGVSQAPPQPA